MPALPWFHIVVAIYIGWVIVAVVTLLSNRRSPTATLAWIFAFAALPFVSGLYYLVFGPRRLQRRRRRYGVARSLAATVSEHLRKTCGARRPQLSDDAVSLTSVGKRLGQGEPTYASAVRLFDSGDETLAALAKAIEGARHHVHLEYYIWEPDGVGSQM